MIPELTNEQYALLQPYEGLLFKIRSGRYLTAKERDFPKAFYTVYSEIHMQVNGKPFKEVRTSCKSCDKNNFSTRLSRWYIEYKIKNKLP